MSLSCIWVECKIWFLCKSYASIVRMRFFVSIANRPLQANTNINILCTEQQSSKTATSLDFYNEPPQVSLNYIHISPQAEGHLNPYKLRPGPNTSFSFSFDINSCYKQRLKLETAAVHRCQTMTWQHPFFHKTNRSSTQLVQFG